MDDSKMMLLAASFLGALIGIYYIVTVNPLDNYFVFVALFALIGVGVANAVMLVVVRVYDWLKQYYSENKDTPQPQAASATVS
jgi:hypothetical protein